jgi:uncharacterized repeat protein (TIGR01451 family)
LAAFGFARLSFRLRDVWLQQGPASDFFLNLGDCVGSDGDTCTTGPLGFTPKAAGLRSDIVHVSVGEVTIEGSGWAKVAQFLIGPFLNMIHDYMQFEIEGLGLSVAPSATSLDLGNITEGTTGPPSNVVVQNVDSQPVTVNAAIVGDHPSDFVLLSPAAPYSLVPGGSLPVELAFRPTKRGIRTAVLELTCNTSGSPTTVSMIGRATGPLVTVAPGGVKFDDTAVQTVSQPAMLTVTNGGDGPLIVSSVSLAKESSPGSFSVVQETCTHSPIPVGESRVVAVAFRPQELGASTATVLLNDNAEDSPQRASLVGIGTPSANLAIAIACPSIAPSGTQVTYEITVRNEGPGTAVQVVMSQDLPSNANFVAFSPAGYQVLAPSVNATGALDCHLGDVQPGKSVTLETTIDVTAPAGGTVVTTVFVSSGTPDPYPHTKSADISFRVT